MFHRIGVAELEDHLELQDPKVREHIRKSNVDHVAGRSRPAEDFLRELRADAHPAPKKKRLRTS